MCYNVIEWTWDNIGMRWWDPVVRSGIKWQEVAEPTGTLVWRKFSK